MTDYQKLMLQLKLCELSMLQVGLELQYNGHLHIETEAILEATQNNITSLAIAIEKVCKDAKTK